MRLSSKSFLISAATAYVCLTTGLVGASTPLEIKEIVDADHGEHSVRLRPPCMFGSCSGRSKPIDRPIPENRVCACPPRNGKIDFVLFNDYHPI